MPPPSSRTAAPPPQNTTSPSSKFSKQQSQLIFADLRSAESVDEVLLQTSSCIKRTGKRRPRSLGSQAWNEETFSNPHPPPPWPQQFRPVQGPPSPPPSNTPNPPT